MSMADEPAGKPDSVVTAEAATGDHPSATVVASGLVRSTRELGRAALERSRRRTRARPFDLAPGGVYRAAPVTRDAGGLLHRRFTLAPSKSRERFVFCGTVPRVTPGGRYPPPCSSESGLSSAVLARRRDRLADSSSRDHKPYAPARHSRNEGCASCSRCAPVATGAPSMERTFTFVSGMSCWRRWLMITAGRVGQAIAAVREHR